MAAGAVVAEMAAVATGINHGAAKEIPTEGATRGLAATMILANNNAGTIEPSVTKAYTR